MLKIKSWEKIKNLNVVLGVWASIATILSLFLSYQVTVEKPKENIVGGDNNGQMVNTESYVNQVFNNPTKYTADEIMRQAQLAYFAEDYEGARRLYSLDSVANNGIALCNIGYMYANGLGAVKNVEVAVRYYERAIELGVDQAEINKFVVLSRNLNDDLVSSFYHYTNELLKDENGEVFKKFKELNGDVAVHSLSEDYVKEYSNWEDTGKTITVSENPENTFYKRYYWTATLPQEQDGKYGRVQIWSEQDRNFELCNYFEDKFIMI